MRVVEPVEPPSFVRAVVGAVTGPDASVVNLLIQTVFAVNRCQNGTNGFAGCVVALLTHQRLVRHVDLVHFGIAVVAIDSQPVHFAVAPHFIAAHYGNVVLHLTSNHAGGTSGTRIEIDHHAPAWPGVRVIGRPQ